MQSAPDWYEADQDDICFEPARKAYSDAVTVFASALSRDPRKSQFVKQSDSIDEVLGQIEKAKTNYESDRGKSRTRVWLSKCSKRITYYGNIMDVLVQHHPEYVSLAWGAMKFIFGAVVNHDTTLAFVAQALAEIAGSLPQTKLVLVLYPTKRMKHAVAELYALILRLLIRAYDWYNEGRFKHAIHSVTRPVEIRYQDIMDDVKRCSHTVEILASAAAQAEQRDMHLKLQEVIAAQKQSEGLLLEMKQLMITHQSINFTAQLDTNHRLSDWQWSQIMKYVTARTVISPAKVLEFGVAMRNARRLKPLAHTEPFWFAPRFQKWAKSDCSALIMVRGTFQRRFEIRDFCVNIVQLLQESGTPVLWALKGVEDNAHKFPSIQILECLVAQALQINSALRTEHSISLNRARFEDATTEEDWFDLLGSVLTGMSRLFIIIDVELICPTSLGDAGSFSSSTTFIDLFRKIAEHSVKTVVKVVLVTYGSPVFADMPRNQDRDLVVSLRRSQIKPIAVQRQSPARNARSLNQIRGRGRGRIPGLAGIV